MIDIDHFKNINDKHGHAAGDAVLISVARELQKLEACGCKVARLAGDEFSVISPREISEAGFANVLSEFSRSAAAIDVDRHDIAITLSIGVSQSHRDGATVEQLLAASDVAMYWGKQNGRSIIRFFGRLG
jgi:diguanylate cyclase (GGDEF)-like protein